ncbi:FlaD/FlaE family flagellar protein [Thermococcus sp.]
MEMTRLVTEADINAKLAELKGKVPSVVINDLREKLIARKENLTYEQLEKIIQKVLETYGNQVTKYEQLSKRVDELGHRLTELSAQLSRLVETLETAKFDVHEKKAEAVSKKVEEVHKKIGKLEEILKEESPEEGGEISEKLEELHRKVEELAEKVGEKSAVEKLEKAKEKLEELQAKLEAGEEVSEEEIESAEKAVIEAQEEAEEQEVEKAGEEKPEVEEVSKVTEEQKPEEVEALEEKVEEIIGEIPEEEGKVETEEALPEKGGVSEVSVEEVPPVHEKEEEKGGVGMAEKLQIPEDIANLLFEEEPRKARLEKLPDDIISTMIALKWLGFLIDRVGIQNLERVLEFYYEIGWISEEVLNQLLRYAKGTRPHHRDPEWKPAEKLTVQDHLISLLFIERLRGLKINRNVLDKLEREIKMLEKTLDEFYGI